MQQKKKILVTGGSGLVGTELLLQLAQTSDEIIAIYNNSPITIKSDNITPCQCNILDTTALEEIFQGITHLYHCAAIVSFSPRNRKELFAINIEGTANVVNAAIEAGVTKMVHVSSVAALGRIREDEAISEKMQWTEEHSNSEYGKSKFLGEMEVWRGVGEGLDAVIVNPSLILGAGDWNKGSSEIFKSAYDEFPWYTEGISGFVDVRDVARAMILLMDSEIRNERFIVSADNVSFKDVFSGIASSFNKKLPSKKVTPLIAEVVWRWESIKSKFTGKDPLLTKETVRTAQAKVFFDNTKLKEALKGFQYLPLEETIRHTCITLQQINNI